MSFAFTARLPLSRHAVDRDHSARANPALFDHLWADARTRVVALWNGKALMAGRGEHESGGDVRLALLAPARLPPSELRLYLGLSLDDGSVEPVGTPLVAAQLGDDAARALEPDESRWASLRELATSLSDRDAGAFAEALGLLNWHKSHTHCPRCGAATMAEDSGWTRRCPTCGSQVFPRTDPAVIVLITDSADRVLLGSNAMWENNRYSLLAGFVEPGESLEAAVIREMFEETGLRVTDPVFMGSQPWPFPASLMCGFTARLDDGQHADGLLPDGEEILELRWFSRDELRASTGTVVLPGPSSIARGMLEQWLGEPIAPGPDRARG